MTLDDGLKSVLVAGGIVVAGIGLYFTGTALGLFHEQVVEGTRQTRRIATPDYALENYRWFKNQAAVIEQVDAQITSTKGEITGYKTDFSNLPRADWPFDAREELARKESILRGYVSQRNMLAGQYNARHSDFTKSWTEGDMPEEIKPFLREYAPLPSP